MKGADIYAGDDAWTEWFKICSVHGCSRDHAAALRREIESAMYSALARFGVAREDAEGEDPVAVFDSYFALRGEREGKKALKAYYAYRIVAEGMELKDFVCGTLFGSGSGRVRDIVLDWIATMKGWRRRTVSRADGTRAAVWEAAPSEAETLERAEATPGAGTDAAETLDEMELRARAAETISLAATQIKVEKAKLALYSLVTALDIPLTEPAVLAALGVGKTRAYLLRDRAIAAIGRALDGSGLEGDTLFARLLVEEAAKMIEPGLRKELIGE